MEDIMASSKVFVTNGNLLRLTTEQRLKAFLEDYHPATIASVRCGEGVLTVIEAATSEQANTAAAALASSSLSIEPLAMVSGDSVQGRQLVQLYGELTQRELEISWTNRQW
jgi:hypothetical protein